MILCVLPGSLGGATGGPAIPGYLKTNFCNPSRPIFF
jgi:hypothetical protein